LNKNNKFTTFLIIGLCPISWLYIRGLFVTGYPILLLLRARGLQERPFPQAGA